LVASDGGIFSFGDAHFYGSTGNIRLNHPIVGMAATVTGKGYWLVASDGGIFNFGNARFLGSMIGQPFSSPIVGMTALDGAGYTGTGYLVVTVRGELYWRSTDPDFPTPDVPTDAFPAYVSYPSCAHPNDPHPTFAGDRLVSASRVKIVGVVTSGRPPLPTSGQRLIWIANSTGRADVPLAIVPDYFRPGLYGNTCGPSQVSLRVMSSPYESGLNAIPPIDNVVGYATTRYATGLWVVASDGGVFVPSCDRGPSPDCV
jgi:hypothetical protein